MTIEEMKDRLVDNQIDYITDLVFKAKHEELFNFVYENIFNNFKDIDDDDIKYLFKEDTLRGVTPDALRANESLRINTKAAIDKAIMELPSLDI